MKPKNRFVQAAIAVIERRGRVLICQRHLHDTFGGLWEFPGGKRKTSESWEECLRRELREELGIVVQAIQAYGSMSYRSAERSVAFRVFRCAIARGRPKLLDARQLRWVSRSQLRRYRFPPANRRLIGRLSRRH